MYKKIWFKSLLKKKGLWFILASLINKENGKKIIGGNGLIHVNRGHCGFLGHSKDLYKFKKFLENRNRTMDDYRSYEDCAKIAAEFNKAYLAGNL